MTFRRSPVGSSVNLVKLADEISSSASDRSSIAGNECRSRDVFETILRRKVFCGAPMFRKCSSIAGTERARRTSVEARLARRDSSGALLGIVGWLHPARIAMRKIEEVSSFNYFEFSR